MSLIRVFSSFNRSQNQFLFWASRVRETAEPWTFDLFMPDVALVTQSGTNGLSWSNNSLIFIMIATCWWVLLQQKRKHWNASSLFIIAYKVEKNVLCRNNVAYWPLFKIMIADHSQMQFCHYCLGVGYAIIRCLSISLHPMNRVVVYF